MFFYLIFGSEFFLWSFVDELLVFGLVVLVPNITFFVTVVSSLVGYTISLNPAANNAGEDMYLIVIFYIIQAFFFNYATYKTLPDAIRYV